MPSTVRSSPLMRQVLALASLGLAVSLAGCGGRVSHNASSDAARVTTTSRTSVRLTPGGFVVQPDISDPSCNNGRGVRLPARLGGDPVLASATMSNGSTLIALSEVYPGSRSAVLQSITRACALNPEFGARGAATITVPSRL
jgi:hypothetical protein